MQAQWIGKKLSHYTILEFIAAGGMGEVFRAAFLRVDPQLARYRDAPRYRSLLEEAGI